MENKIYTTTIRLRHPKHIELIERVKKDYFPTSLSKALLHAIRELYELKEDREKLRKAVKTKYEIDSKVLKDVFDLGY